MKIDVLNLAWTSYPGRDRIPSTLTCNYLRYRGLTVIEDSPFAGFKMIDTYRPRLLFMADKCGAYIHPQLIKYAAIRGIKVIAFHGEGNIKETETEENFWGWNKEHISYEDIDMQWSERAKQICLKIDPKMESHIKVAGAVGFDYYKIVRKNDKNSFLNEFGKFDYEKIIGIGCWDFSIVSPSDYRYSYHESLYGKNGVVRFRKDRDDFNEILLKVIHNNPDILFLLKEHPGNDNGYCMSAVAGCEKFSNVIIVKKEPIFDCIAVSDFWLTYESTTVIEAWLIGKQTCLLNPSGIDFPRANVYLGSPNYPDAESLQNAINIFYTSGSLPGFRELQKDRETVIKDTIQWDDGLNHVRAGNEMIRLLNEPDSRKKKTIPFDLRMVKLRQKIASLGLPGTRGSFTYQHLKEFNRRELHEFAQMLYNRQIDFYKTRGLTQENLSEIRAV